MSSRPKFPKINCHTQPLVRPTLALWRRLVSIRGLSIPLRRLLPIPLLSITLWWLLAVALLPIALRRWLSVRPLRNGSILLLWGCIARIARRRIPLLVVGYRSRGAPRGWGLPSRRVGGAGRRLHGIAAVRGVARRVAVVLRWRRGNAARQLTRGRRMA